MVLQVVQKDAGVILNAMVQAEDTVLREVAALRAIDLFDVRQVVVHSLLVSDRAEGKVSLVVMCAKAITVLCVNEGIRLNLSDRAEGEMRGVLKEGSTTNAARLATCQQNKSGQWKLAEDTLMPKDHQRRRQG